MGINNPKISVIIPVYNVEKYLERCIESVISQTLRDIEIIIINDGSTDNSYSIINKFAEVDDRIRVFSHDNIGLGPTRNRGIEVATGEYLAFVDSDDWLVKGGLELLYKRAIETNADIVEGETSIFFEDTGVYTKRKSLTNVSDVCVSTPNIEEFYRDYYFGRLYTHNAWDKIYRTEFIVKNQIYFGDNKRIFAEDNWFQLQIFLLHPKIAFVDSSYYIYRQRQNSIMNSPKKNLVKRHMQMVIDYQNLIADIPEFVTETKVCSLLTAEVFTIEAMNSLVANNKFKDFHESLKYVYSNDKFYNNIKNVLSLKAYRLVPNKSKRLYLRFISALYFIKLYKLAHFLVWIIYKARENRK